MGAVCVIVGDVIREQSLQVARVDWNHVVEQFAAAASHPAFGNAVLLGTAKRSSRAGDFHSADCGRDLQTILGIRIEDQELGYGVVGKGFPQLLHDPRTRGMSGDVEVQDAAAVVTDDEEAIEQAEVQGGDGEKIHRCYGVAVIAQKS